MDAPAPFPTPRTALPIVVGVAGHRDVLERPSDPTLKPPREVVEREIRALLDDFPNSPVLVLSGLAEGADTLVAEVTLALAADPAFRGADGRPRIGLATALPGPLDVLAHDFLDPAHRAVVERFRERAQVTIDVFTPEDLPPEGLPRPLLRRWLDEAYARLGAYVSRHGHLLLALTDGKSKREGTLGGTADVVSWFLEGAPDEFLRPPPPPNPLRIPDGLRVIRIPCERASQPGVVRDSRTPQAILDEKKRADAVLGQIDEYNEDVATLAPQAGPVPIDEAFERSTPGAPAPGRAVAATYLDARLDADTLANRYQADRASAIGRLFGIAAGALLAFELYAHGPGGIRDHASLMILYLVAVAGSVILVRRAKARHLEPKYLVYRSFAEASRVQALWTVFGLPDRADDHYSALHADAISWVRHALKSLHVRAAHRPTPAPSDPSVFLPWVGSTWIDDQIEYFESRVSARRTRLRTNTLWARRLFVVGALLAVAAIVLHAVGASHDLSGLVLIGIAAAFAGSALCRGWASQMAWEATVDRYESAAAVFRRAGARLESARDRGDTAGALAVVRALGIEALRENVEWVLLHRDHPLEIRAGG